MNGLYTWTPGKAATFVCVECKREWTITEQEYANRTFSCADCMNRRLEEQIAAQRQKERLEYRMKALDRGIKALGCGTALTKEQQNAAMTLGLLILEEEGILDPSLRWTQLLYGAPLLYTPKRNVVFKNVGGK